MKRLPVPEWLPGYDTSWLKSDIFAGLTVWALVVPQAIAYAQIAGLPPQAGVFASFAAPLGYALFGTSRQLICSPTSATAAISFALVAPAVADNPEDFAAMSGALAILCGLVYFLLGKLKMGFISQFIASAVQVGFLFGLGMTIIIGQLFKVFGIDGNEGAFYKQFWHFLKHLGDTNGWTLAIGAASLIALAVLGRVMPGLPSALILVVASIVIVSVFDLADRGVEVVGEVDRAFPTPKIPIVDLEALLTLVPGTLAIVIVGYSESISVARRFAEERRYEIRPDQELTALGFSSALGGLFQGFITGGGASQSAANDRAGAKTQAAGVVLAILAALTAIALMPVFENLPMAVLGAIVINAVVGFMNVPALRRLRDLRRDSFLLALMALLGVLFLGILPGLLITVSMSVLLLLSRISRPVVEEMAEEPETGAFVSTARHPDAVPEPGLLVVRPDVPLMFVNVAWIRDDIKEKVAKAAPKPRVVVLDLEGTSSIDISTIDSLTSLHRDLESEGIALWLAAVRKPVHDLLQSSGLAADLGEARIYPTVAAAKADCSRPASG